MFASIEDSDSDPDNHGEDSSSNTSADDHMTTKRSQCCLQGAGVKEVREFAPTEIQIFALVGLVVVPLESPIMHYFDSHVSPVSQRAVKSPEILWLLTRISPVPGLF